MRNAPEIPTFTSWFAAKYQASFEQRYRHPGVRQDEYLARHIEHSREYMHEQLQLIASAASAP